MSYDVDLEVWLTDSTRLHEAQQLLIGMLSTNPVIADVSVSVGNTEHAPDNTALFITGTWQRDLTGLDDFEIDSLTDAVSGGQITAKLAAADIEVIEWFDNING